MILDDEDIKQRAIDAYIKVAERHGYKVIPQESNLWHKMLDKVGIRQNNRPFELYISVDSSYIVNDEEVGVYYYMDKYPVDIELVQNEALITLYKEHHELIYEVNHPYLLEYINEIYNKFNTYIIFEDLHKNTKEVAL